MQDEQWKRLLELARAVLGKGASASWASDSWCGWTTFSSLEHQLTYWARGVPDAGDLLADRTVDGGLWPQSFYYHDLAHIIFPASFYWERMVAGAFQSGYKTQDITRLSAELHKAAIPHRLTEMVLEVKLY